MTAAQLKASILDLAIRGKLVPQNPNDEPAEKLLARIWNERFGHGEHGEHGEIFNAEKQRSRGRAASMNPPRGRGRSPSGPHGRARTLAAPQPIPDEEKPFDLPAGWAWCRLGDVAEIADGDHLPPPQVPSGIPFLVISNVCSGVLSFEKTRFVPIEYFESISDNRKPNRGDILLTVTGSYGIPLIITDSRPFCFQRHIAILKTQFDDNSFLKYVLESAYAKRYYDDVATGIAQRTVSLSSLRRMRIPLPPLAEQHRIVAKIEELMPLVKRYEAAEQRRVRLDAALPEALKKSILKAAFDGALLEGCAFEEMPLNKACSDIFTGNSLSETEKRTFTRPDGLPFIGTKDVGFDQVVDYENGIRIPESETYRTAPAGASLLCIEGGSSGRKIGLLDRAVRFGNKLCAFAPGEGLDSRYLFLYLQSPQFLEQFAALQNGPRKGAGISQIKSLTIRVSAPAHQRQLVERIDALLHHADEIKVVEKSVKK